jgi:hypothetical protein
MVPFRIPSLMACCGLKFPAPKSLLAKDMAWILGAEAEPRVVELSREVMYCLHLNAIMNQPLDRKREAGIDLPRK